MTNMENYNESDVADIEVDAEKHGVAFLFEGIDPITLEELDHNLEAEGFSINTIEDAFEYLEDAEWNELNTTLKNYVSASNADLKNKYFNKILDLIK